MRLGSGSYVDRSPAIDISEDAIGLAKKIKAVISDVDGVFTNNQVLEGASFKAKWRSYYDGQGVSLLRAIGLRVCLITNEKGDSAKHISDVVDKWNNLPSSLKIEGDGGWSHVKLYTGRGGTKKVEAAEEWLRKIDVSFGECAYMGDDLVDADLLRRVAFRAAPAQADPYIKQLVHLISGRPGGMGAFRDLVNFILASREIDPLSLPLQ